MVFAVFLMRGRGEIYLAYFFYYPLIFEIYIIELKIVTVCILIELEIQSSLIPPIELKTELDYGLTLTLSDPRLLNLSKYL